MLTAIRRRLALFLAVLGGVIVLAAIALALRTPLYMATAEVVIDTRIGAAEGGATTGDRLATEIAILKSREMAGGVATALGLRGGDAAVLPAGLWRRLASAFGMDRAAPAEHPREARRRLVDRLQDALSVTRPDSTYALAIGYAAPDPAMAARIANGYARRYVAERGGAVGVATDDKPGARLISAAEPALRPASPGLPVGLAVAAAAGLLLATGAAMLAERRFAGLTGSSDIETRLGLHHLGSVPILASVLPGATSPLETVVDAPMSGFVESFRSVMLAARHAGGRGMQVFAITSALPNEGKSTIAACLARTVALGGEAVVLIDCDGRRRDASAMFHADAPGPGLAEVLRQEATLDEALVRDAASGAWILPLRGPPSEISDLLTGDAMETLIGTLRGRFKRILIDTAPILPISATRAVVTMADIVVMVVRWRTTPDHAVKTALHMLPAEGVRIGGVVLSQVDMKRQVKFGRGDQTYYYQAYSKYYS